MYVIELLSFGNGMYFAFIYLLNTIQVSEAIVHVVHLGGLTANVTHLDTSQINQSINHLFATTQQEYRYLH
jgi:hypothetical protein